MFESLLGDPLTLFQDVLDHPQDYDEELPVLLQEVVQGSKKLEDLSEDDRRRLDDAVLVFVDPAPSPAAAPDPPADAPAPAPPGPKRAAPKRTTPIERVLAEHSTPTVPVGPPNIPEAPPTFWWKKGDKKDQ